MAPPPLSHTPLLARLARISEQREERKKRHKRTDSVHKSPSSCQRPTWERFILCFPLRVCQWHSLGRFDNQLTCNYLFLSIFIKCVKSDKLMLEDVQYSWTRVASKTRRKNGIFAFLSVSKLKINLGNKGWNIFRIQATNLHFISSSLHRILFIYWLISRSSWHPPQSVGVENMQL